MSFLKKLFGGKPTPTLPSDYGDFMTPAEYDAFVKHCVKVLKALGFSGLKPYPDEGRIDLEPQAGHTNQVYLDSLVRRYVQIAPNERELALYSHFQVMLAEHRGQPASEQSFDDIAASLRLRVVRSDLITGMPAEILNRPLAMGLNQAVCQDFPTHVAYVMADALDKWNESADTVFDLAFRNTLPEIQYCEHTNELGTWFEISADGYAPAPLIRPEESQLPGLVGNCGTLAVFTCANMVVALPVNQEGDLEQLFALIPFCQEVYATDPKPLEMIPYWYHEGEWHRFIHETNTGKVTPPQELFKVLYQ